MAAPELRQIDWSSARFEDGTLTVELSGRSAKEWNARFATLFSPLDPRHSDWGEVRQTKNRIRVADVRQGTESELRHFLESIVLQANSDVGAEETSQASDDEAQNEPPTTLDAQMTETFMSFEAD